MSFFKNLAMMPEDPILGLPIQLAEDPREKKVNLGIGAYRTAEGLPFVLSTVKKVEAELLNNGHDKEYLPIVGHKQYLQNVKKLLLGSENAEKCYSFEAQSVGGSGALRLIGEFLARSGTIPFLYLPEPSWPNHQQIFHFAGLQQKSYPYYNRNTHAIDFLAICKAIQEMPEHSVILLQACCNNPTGMDLTHEQWRELSKLIKKQNIIPFFDIAYQGFGRGLEEDAFSIRQFYQDGHELFIANSFSKNFGLYGERVGTALFITDDNQAAARVGSHIKKIIRGNYSNPPLHGALIVAAILNDAELKTAWEKELAAMRERLKAMREELAKGLLAKGAKEFEFLLKQMGIFSYLGLSEKQVLRLKSDFAIYMPLDGRINVAGLNQENMAYVIDAILAVHEAYS